MVGRPGDFHQALREHTLPVQRLRHAEFERRNLQVWMIRADQVHPVISGNKWFKLKYNLLAARDQGARRLLSFGGAYSNHLHALAYAGWIMGISTVGVVRGEPVDNATLRDARRWGMELVFVSRQQYRQRYDLHWQRQLLTELAADQVIPEGGSNLLALRGVAELLQRSLQALPQLDYLLTACGSGGTLAGLIAAAPASLTLQGFAVLKEGVSVYRQVATLLAAQAEPACSWSLDLNAHYGGFAKVNPQQRQHWQSLQHALHVPLDPVYTAKLLRRFLEKVMAGEYPQGAHIGVLHSGGLQGCRSI